LEVRQAEGGFAIAAEIGAKQGKQRGVLRDGKELAVARRPIGRIEAEGKELDFAEKVIAHDALS
jgi:hypothetical protein